MNDQLKNQEIKPTHTARPQEPKAPFSYREEEVSYENKAASVTLAGTLTQPQGNGPFPAVILIAGMGPMDRNASMAGHKLFWVLADHLTNNGIAVLRFDKRGVGKSTGTFSHQLISKNFADDVVAGVEFLKTCNDIDSKKIGLIGISEGGMIAPMVAIACKDIAFIVLMAGVIETNAKLAAKQATAQMAADGASEEFLAKDRSLRSQIAPIIMEHTDIKKTKHMCMAIIDKYLDQQSEAEKLEAEKLSFAFTSAKAEVMVNMYNSPWYRYLLSYNPVETLKKVTVPVLALHGTLDHIISSKRALSLIAKTLNKAGNKQVTIVELPGLNHAFQTCETGAISEYATTEETIAPKALDTITQWIVSLTT